MRTSVFLKLSVLFALVLVAPVRCEKVSPCDLNADGVVNSDDYDVAKAMALGGNCTANINGQGVCNVVTVQRVANAVRGLSCDVSNGSHYVLLNWIASTSVVVGYNIYRSTTSSGPYAKINSSVVVPLFYYDLTVVAGTTYYYVATAVDSDGNESVYSNEASAVVPSP